MLVSPGHQTDLGEIKHKVNHMVTLFRMAPPAGLEPATQRSLTRRDSSEDRIVAF